MSGRLLIREIRKIQRKHHKYAIINYFVETGTYKGGTTFGVCKWFKGVETIELSKNIHKSVVIDAAYRRIKNIRFHCGDSATILPKIIKRIKKPIIYFLDGHSCGVGTNTAKGKINPLLTELRAINKQRNCNDIVVIDDFRIFNKQKFTYPDNNYWSQVTIESVLDCFSRGKIYEYCEHNDRFIIYMQKESNVPMLSRVVDLIKPTVIRYKNKVYLKLTGLL